jgi:N-acyl amino acid synthase of PEP-CTERM/exosortase system
VEVLQNGTVDTSRYRYSGRKLPYPADPQLPLHEKIRMTSAAEISRFAISKKMRNLADGDCPKDLKCSMASGLMRAIVQMSLECGITHWFAVMEPSLLRLLSRFCIYFEPIGPLVEYHGLRQPCHANVDALLGRLRREYFDLWEFLTVSNSSTIREKVAIACSR